MAQSSLSASPSSSSSCFSNSKTSMAPQSLVSASAAPSCFSIRTGARRRFHPAATSPLDSSSNCRPSHALAQCRYSGDQECNCSCSDSTHVKCRGRRDVLAISCLSICLFPPSAAHGKPKSKAIYDERRLLEQNRKIQQANNAPEDFPNFIREGFDVKVVTSDNYIKRDSGLIYRDFEVGTGECPKDGQQVTFHYIGYNESGRRIDSTYLQGAPAKIRLGNKTLVPGFEEGIRDMKPGGKRRIIIPPELGPPVGPSTFFSAKQFEVFDIELLRVQDCQRRTIGFYSDVVCT